MKEDRKRSNRLKHGGKREGAGRKAINKKHKSLRVYLDDEHWQFINQMVVKEDSSLSLYVSKLVENKIDELIKPHHKKSN